jgi:hypothetical protein
MSKKGKSLCSLIVKLTQFEDHNEKNLRSDDQMKYNDFLLVNFNYSFGIPIHVTKQVLSSFKK